MPLSTEPRPRRIHHLGLWIGYWIALFAITHRPLPGGVGLSIPGADKGIHLVLYFILALLGGRYLRASTGALSPPRLIRWACVYIAYGAFDEWLQQFVHRTPSWGDWFADVIGVVLATLVLWRRGRPARSQA